MHHELFEHGDLADARMPLCQAAMRGVGEDELGAQPALRLGEGDAPGGRARHEGGVVA